MSKFRALEFLGSNKEISKIVESTISTLEREFNLNLITTAPSVIYKVCKQNNEIIELYNPVDLPPLQEIKS